jgi:hypothetical protein
VLPKVAGSSLVSHPESGFRNDGNEEHRNAMSGDSAGRSYCNHTAIEYDVLVVSVVLGSETADQYGGIVVEGSDLIRAYFRL